jgi:nitrogen-specific signal transduction histidine kinase
MFSKKVVKYLLELLIGEGVGVGMSISRSIIVGHGGSIEYELTSDGHTSFVIVLPKGK